MPEIKYSDNPNEETAFVETDDGQRNRAVLTAAVDGEIEFPANPNSTKVSVTVDGVKRKAIAVATIAGSSGGDQHNLGYYATQAALEEAYPTAEAGDWAIVGATDTVWLWDSDNSEWVDSDQKGQVTSVNSQTGDVTITATSISALPTTGGTLTGNLEMSNSKVQLHNTTYAFSYWLDAYLSGHLRIAKSSSISNGDLFISTGSGGSKSIAFGEDGGQLGSGAAKFERTYTQKLNNGADITVPTTGGMMALQESTMPTADAASVGVVVQYVGATDANYTNGYFYKCVSDGQEPATYSWEEVSLGGGGGSSYTAGNGINIDANNEISVTAPTLQNNTTQTDSVAILGTTDSSYGYQSVVIGSGAFQKVGGISIGYKAGQTISNNYNIIIGCLSDVYSASVTGALVIGYQNKVAAYSVAINGNAISGYSTAINGNVGSGANYAIQLGGGTNSTANTFKVANANGNFEIMSADGTIPEARLADTTGASQGDVLTLDSNGDATWAAPSGGGVSSISVTLPAADWSGSAQTVTATGVTSSNTVIVGAAPASQAEYTTCGVVCTAQGTDSLSFTCTSTPTNDLTVTVLILA